MLPALPAIGESLLVANTNNLQLVITLFIFGMFFGELLFGPLSDAMGRKKALALGVAIYCVGTLVAMAATSLEIHLTGRVIQGVGVSGPKIISRAMIRDKFEGNRMAKIFSFIMMIFIAIPMIAPWLGQMIVAFAGWRAIFILFLSMAIGATGWIMISQPETLPPEKRRSIQPLALLRTSFAILGHRRVLCCTATTGLVFGIFLFYLSSSQAMFHSIYNRQESFPLYFAILASGFGLAAFLNSRLVMEYGMYRLCRGGLLGLLAIGGYLLVGMDETGNHSFISFMLVCYALMFCVGLLFSNLSAMAMQPLGEVAGLGASVISALGSLTAVAISVSVGRFYDDTLMPLTLTILICGLVSFVMLQTAQSAEDTLVVSRADVPAPEQETAS